MGGRHWRPVARAGRCASCATPSSTGSPTSWTVPGRPGLGRLGRRPAVDPGPGRGADPPPVRRHLHPPRGVLPAAPDRLDPAGPGPPRGRARRRRHRRVADDDLGEGARLAAQQGAWICFEDEAGQTLRPPRARTWGRRGHAPVVRVSGKGSGRISIAGLLAYRPGQRGHFYYRLVVHRGRRGERRSLSEADYATLLSAAHQQLHADHPDLGQPQHPPQQADAGVPHRACRLADRRAAPRLRPRTQRHRGRLVAPQTRPGQLHRHRHRPARHPREDPAQADQYRPAPAWGPPRPAHRLP